jgi:outer membrane protein assembly factor BamB
VGFRQRITFSTAALIGVAAYSERTQLLYVVNPHGTLDGRYKAGIAAFRINASCGLTLAWQAPDPVTVGSTPIVAGDVVYYSGGFNGQVRALDAYTGARRWSSGSNITLPVEAAPTVANGRVYVADYGGGLHAFGL